MNFWNKTQCHERKLSKKTGLEVWFNKQSYTKEINEQTKKSEAEIQINHSWLQLGQYCCRIKWVTKEVNYKRTLVKWKESYEY